MGCTSSHILIFRANRSQLKYILRTWLDQGDPFRAESSRIAGFAVIKWHRVAWHEVDWHRP